MRFPPWLVGLVVVLLLGALWWSLAWDGGDDESTAPVATPAPSVLPSSPHTPSSAPDAAPHPAPTGTDTRPWDGIDACEDDILPATMVPVVEDIWTGGPYDHPDRDGTRFGNYERYLPDEDLGYYREYTVRTPGLEHRGPRRIVTGGGTEDEPEVWFYTEDHYASFCEFAP